MRKMIFTLYLALLASIGTTFAAITVRLNPESCYFWSTVRIWAWTDTRNLFDAWPGEVVSKDADGWYSYTFDDSITKVNIVWNDGTGSQTVDCLGVIESMCFALNGVGQDNKYRVVDVSNCPSYAFYEQIQIGDLYYNLDEYTRRAEVTYKSKGGALYNSDWDIKTADIPATVEYNSVTYDVTSIGADAFSDCSGLTSVTIPNSVTYIGYEAFYRCSALQIIEIPNSVIGIGKNAFYDVFNVAYSGVATGSPWGAKNVNRPGDGWLVYSDATKTNLLACSTAATGEIAIPNSVTNIQDSAFCNCNKITSVTIPNSVTTIGDGVFRGCFGLTSVSIPNSVTSIGNSAFVDCSNLTSVTFSNNVTSIKASTFYGCGQLSSFTIPNSVTSIGGNAFAKCYSLASINIPNSVTSIGENAFAKCTSLPVVDNIRYADTYLILVVDQKQSSYTIKENTRWIAPGAFSQCSNVTSIEIPNSVTSIGASAFYECSSLTSVTIPGSVTSIGKGAFARSFSITSVYITNLAAWCNIDFDDNASNPCYYAPNLYLNNELITNLTIPNSITSIKDRTFGGCSCLTSVTIPNSVTSIGTSAFGACSGMTSVVIGSGVISIGDYAFSGCSSLTSVTIPNSVTSIGYRAFQDCYELTSVTCLGETPANIDLWPWNYTDSLYFYVPCNALQAYKTAWKYYETQIKGSGSECQEFTITFVNWDGEELQSSLVMKGEMPEYSGETPYREADKYYTYRFSGWTPEIVAVSEEATYTATFKRTPTEDLGTADEIETTEVTAISTDGSSVTITWPAIEKATTYTIEISHRGELVCTLIFNEIGQLLAINYGAPARHGNNRNVAAATQTNKGWSYIITGLEAGASYTYSVTAKDDSDATLFEQSIDFTTSEQQGIEAIEAIAAPGKVIIDGKLYILRDDKVFTATGQQVK